MAFAMAGLRDQVPEDALTIEAGLVWPGCSPRWERISGARHTEKTGPRPCPQLTARPRFGLPGTARRAGRSKRIDLPRPSRMPEAARRTARIIAAARTQSLWHTPDSHVSHPQKLPNYIEHIAALQRDQG